VESSLSAKRLAGHGVLDPGAVDELLRAHYAGQADHATRIWTLLMFQCWYDLYLGAGALPEVPQEVA
jgi:asparagine synthase (glutamine-hydrolysing)